LEKIVGLERYLDDLKTIISYFYDGLVVEACADAILELGVINGDLQKALAKGNPP